MRTVRALLVDHKWMTPSRNLTLGKIVMYRQMRRMNWNPGEEYVRKVPGECVQWLFFTFQAIFSIVLTKNGNESRASSFFLAWIKLNCLLNQHLLRLNFKDSSPGIILIGKSNLSEFRWIFYWISFIIYYFIYLFDCFLIFLVDM